MIKFYKRLLLSEKRTDDTLQFHYDTNTNLFSVLIGGERYLYVKNIQNDIIGLIDTNGNQVVEYKYDSWGNTMSIIGSKASTVGVKNPFRYRGYYLDAETGLYYVGSRYYDPAIGRLISPDTTEVLTAVLIALRDKNLYVYCDNNSVNYSDIDGYFPIPAVLVKVGLVALDVVLSIGVTCITAKVTGEEIIAGDIIKTAAFSVAGSITKWDFWNDIKNVAIALGSGVDAGWNTYKNGYSVKTAIASGCTVAGTYFGVNSVIGRYVD